MSTTDVIICPDCGGIVGATKVTDQGKPCICFNDKTGGLMPHDVPEVKKVCCHCGKDLAGLKRLKDSMGYWCYDCHKADEKNKHPGGVRCAECGRKVPDAALIEYSGVRICRKCKADHDQVKKQKLQFRANVAGGAHEAQDRRRLYIMLAVALVLIGIIVLSRLHVLGSML
jgi:DNA-directed RNA polymerase subunit RPC12/RpoP